MKKIILFFYLIFSYSVGYGQQVAGDTLVADFKFLVKSLEETHPDPYTGFGGKVFFHKKAFDIEQHLKNGATLDEFASQMLYFISYLKDGHTYIARTQSNTANVPNLRLPLQTMIIPDGLIVSKIPDSHKKHLGSKVTSINGIHIEELSNKVAKLVPRENIYDKYNWLSMCIGYYRQMKRLLPEMEENITIELEARDGDKEILELTYMEGSKLGELKMAETPKWTKIRDEFLYYNYLDKETMYIRISSIMSREPFLYMRDNGWSEIEEELKGFYQYNLKQEMPADIDEAIAAIPGINEIFRQMLEKMKLDKTRYLIIDLRSNGGGFTPSIYPTLYMLYGDKYLEKEMDANFYRLISPLYVQKNNMTLEEFNTRYNTDYQFGDYTFPADQHEEKEDITERRNSFVNNAMGDAGKYIKDLDGKPVYEMEKIFVITDEQTFSAAFHYAFYLWKMGATVVGVPSRQAPNTFMEVTPFQLPLTKLKGSISNAFQVFFPANDKRAKIFYPDIMLKWEDYKKYEFDKYSDIRYLLESLN